MIKYCTKRLREQDNKEYYSNIFSSDKAVKMCMYNLSAESIYKINVSEASPDEETPYVGWLEPDGNINFIFPNLVLLEVCFPYGTKPEIALGKGKIIRVFIEEIN